VTTRSGFPWRPAPGSTDEVAPAMREQHDVRTVMPFDQNADDLLAPPLL